MSKVPTVAEGVLMFIVGEILAFAIFTERVGVVVASAVLLAVAVGFWYSNRDVGGR